MQANNNIGWSIYEISYPYAMTLTYLKYAKQLTVTFPIFLMKWKRQSSIFFWLNIIYIRTHSQSRPRDTTGCKTAQNVPSHRPANLGNVTTQVTVVTTPPPAHHPQG